MIEKLDKRNTPTDIDFEPNEGERTLLSSNKGGMRSPSLDLEDILNDNDNERLKKLAEILAEAIVWQTKDANSK